MADNATDKILLDNKVWDSIYTATYDADSQTIQLHDIINDLYSFLEFIPFKNQTNNYFGVHRAERIILSLCCGRTLTISWVDQKVGYKVWRGDAFHEILKRALNPENIQAEQDMATAWKRDSLMEHREWLVSHLGSDL